METKLHLAVAREGRAVSSIALGCMSLAGTWNPADVKPENVKRAVETFEAAVECGITFYDHADIYGGTACESIFKECLASVPGIRERIVIATKCGIRGGYYQLDSEYINRSLEASLERMGIEYVDVYQMHRPDPLTHPRETAAGLKEVVKRGLAKHVAVSNYYPEQLRALQHYLDDLPIVSNQVEISLLRLEPIYEGEAPWRGEGVLDQCMDLNITPLAWSPLGKGWLSDRKPVPEDHPQKAVIQSTLAALRKQAEKHGATPGQIALAWLVAHPAGIIPLVGTADPEHIREAAGAATIALSRTDWYEIWTAARGKPVM